MGRSDVSAASASGGQRRKSVLVCPACGHESPPDGDWVVLEEGEGAGRRYVYVCPVCEETLTVRPAFESDPVCRA